MEIMPNLIWKEKKMKILGFTALKTLDRLGLTLKKMLNQINVFVLV